MLTSFFSSLSLSSARGECEIDAMLHNTGGGLPLQISRLLLVPVKFQTSKDLKSVAIYVDNMTPLRHEV